MICFFVLCTQWTPYPYSWIHYMIFLLFRGKNVILRKVYFSPTSTWKRRPIFCILHLWLSGSASHIWEYIFHKLLRYNVKPLLERSKHNLDWSSNLPISIAGRVNSVTITVLPKLLYSYRNPCLFFLFKNFQSSNFHHTTIHHSSGYHLKYVNHIISYFMGLDMIFLEIRPLIGLDKC